MAIATAIRQPISRTLDAVTVGTESFLGGFPGKAHRCQDREPVVEIRRDLAKCAAIGIVLMAGIRWNGMGNGLKTGKESGRGRVSGRRGCGRDKKLKIIKRLRRGCSGKERGGTGKKTVQQGAIGIHEPDVELWNRKGSGKKGTGVMD
jgi:hypothetical protein